MDLLLFLEIRSELLNVVLESTWLLKCFRISSKMMVLIYGLLVYCCLSWLINPHLFPWIFFLIFKDIIEDLKSPLKKIYQLKLKIWFLRYYNTIPRRDLLLIRFWIYLCWKILKKRIMIKMAKNMEIIKAMEFKIFKNKIWILRRYNRLISLMGR